MSGWHEYYKVMAFVSLVEKRRMKMGREKKNDMMEVGLRISI
jgi:hypothetical protein